MANINQWKVGDIISASKLNEMVNAINNLLQQQIPEIDTSNLVTTEQLTTILQGYSDVGHTHHISEIVDLVLPTVPTKLSQLENDTDFTTVTQVNQAIANAQLGGSQGTVDLSSYAKKTDIPTRTGQLTNDSGFITEIPSEYITEDELNAKGYLTQHQDISNKADKSDIPTKTSELQNDTDFATNASVDEKIANVATGGQVDLTSYAKKTDLPTKVSQLANDSNFISSIPEEYVTEQELNAKRFATETFVTNKIAEASIGGGTGAGSSSNIEYNQFNYLSNVFTTNFESDSTVNVTSVSILGNNTVTIDDTITLTAKILPANASNKNVTWSVNNSNATIVPNGLSCTVRGVTEGESVITVTTKDGNHSATKTITVSASGQGGGEIGQRIAINPDLSEKGYTTNRDSVSSAYFILDYKLQEGTVDEIKVYNPNTNIVVYVLEPTDNSGEWQITHKQSIADTGASWSSNSLNLPVTSTSRLMISGKFGYIMAGSNDLERTLFLNVTESTTTVPGEVGNKVTQRTDVGYLKFMFTVYYTPSNSSTSNEVALSSLALSDSDTSTNFKYINCSKSNKLQCSGNAMAYFDKYLTFDTYNLKSRIIITDTTAKFGLMCKHDVKGALYLVNLADNTISLHAQYTGDYTIPTTKASTTLTIPIILNQEYIIEVKKTGWKHTFSITNIMTGESDEVTFDNSTQFNSSGYCGKGWGSPGVICISGSVTFKNLIYNVANFDNPKALIIGDSITEGTNMGANVDIKYRYASLMRDNIYQGQALICGRGGDTSSGVIERLNNLYSIGFSCPIVIVTIGTNEVNGVASWKTNIDNIVNMVKAQGAIPIIAVPPARSSSFGAIQEMRDYILSKNYNTIRFDIATTLDRDGEHCDTSLFTDGIHPNQSGGLLMYNQAKLELGLLL